MRERIDAVALVRPDEMAEIVRDYASLVVQTSFARYGEFLHGST